MDNFGTRGQEIGNKIYHYNDSSAIN